LEKFALGFLWRLFFASDGGVQAGVVWIFLIKDGWLWDFAGGILKWNAF
jgi:hypothetical protein